MSPKAKQKPAGKAGQKDNQEKSSPARRQDPNVKVPYLLDFLYNFAVIFIVLVGILVAALSLTANVDLLHVALRTGVAVLVLGIALFGLSWYLSKSSLDAALKNAEEQMQAAQGDGHSTKEVEA